jgi:hypothetical protein
MNRISQSILDRDDSALVESAKIHPNLDSPQEHRQAITLAFSKGTGNQSVCFLHGTSLAVLDHALLTGILPGGIQKNDEGSSRFYILNLPSRFSYTPKHCTLPTDDSSAQKLAEDYAGSISSDFDCIRALEGELSRIKGKTPRTLNECLSFRAGNYRFPSDLYESEGLDRKSAERIDRTITHLNRSNTGDMGGSLTGRLRLRKLVTRSSAHCGDKDRSNGARRVNRNRW